MQNVLENTTASIDAPAAIRSEIDNLVSYAVHLVGDHTAASEYVVAGIQHAIQFPPASWSTEGRASLYRSVTRTCKQRKTFPPRPTGFKKLVNRPQEAAYIEFDPTEVGKINTVKRALMTMPFERRAALLLKDYSSLTYREIARSMECSPLAAGRLIAMARREFGAILKEIAI